MPRSSLMNRFAEIFRELKQPALIAAFYIAPIFAFMEIGADEDEARWDERLKKVAKAKPQPEKSR